jgi:hypothetical protein
MLNILGFHPKPHPLFEKSGAKTLTLRIWAECVEMETVRTHGFTLKFLSTFFKKWPGVGWKPTVFLRLC